MPVADPVFSGDQVQHDGLGNSGLKKVDFNQLTLEPLVLQTRVVQLCFLVITPAIIYFNAVIQAEAIGKAPFL